MVIDENVIYRLAGQGMMGVAMRMLRKGNEEMPYELQGQYDNVEMLLRQYYRYQDKAMTANVKGALLELVDDIYEWKAGKSAIRYEHSVRRNWHINNDTLMVALSADYDIAKGITIELDAQLIVLFRQVWLSGKLDGNSIRMLREFVMSDRNEFVRKIVVGAIMLRCIRYYDARLVEMLMESNLAESCVAVVMIAMARQKRIDCDETSLKLYRQYLADSDNLEKCALVYNNVMRTFETQNIASEMRDKIFPIVREQGLKFKEDSANIRLFDENGLNPEWEEKLEESGIIDKMRRINDLQLNGADIHYESFQMMKSTPFFMETAHWFYPFDMRYHQLVGMNGEDGDKIGDIPKLLNLCDSDRYSLFLMLKGMGVGGLKEALQNLGLGNFDEVREQLGDEEKWKETMKISFATEVRFAVMNLYRFYKLAPNHSDMTTPFARVMPAEDSELGYSIVPAKIRYAAASILFKARQWEAAHAYYKTIVEEYIAEDPLLYQKMGYCKEKMQKWDEAIDEYGRSDVVVPDDIWTLRHTAYCLRQTGDNDMAAGIYRKVLELDKESTEATDNLAEIYIEAEDYADAKPLLYEMAYRRGSKDDERNLGFCLFMSGEHGEALGHLDKACGMNGATSAEFMMRAICGGDETRISEACAMIYDAEGIAEEVSKGAAGKMMERLGEDEREKVKSTINKIILEQ